MLGRIWRAVRSAPLWLIRRVGIDGWREISTEKDLHEPLPDIQPLIDLEIGIASDRDVERMYEVLAEPFKSEFEGFFDERDTCLIAQSNGRIAGYTWVTCQPFEYPHGTIVRYEADAAYTYGSQVLPEFRGKKVFECLTREMYLYLKNKGFRYACNAIDAKNVASIAAKRRLGARINTLHFLKLPSLPLMVFGRRRFVLERGDIPEPAPKSGED